MTKKYFSVIFLFFLVLFPFFSERASVDLSARPKTFFFLNADELTCLQADGTVWKIDAKALSAEAYGLENIFAIAAVQSKSFDFAFLTKGQRLGIYGGNKSEEFFVPKNAVRINGIAANPNGTLFLLGLENGVAVAVSRYEKDKVNFLTHSDAVSSVVFNRDGKKALVYSRDGKLVLWQVNPFTAEKEFATFPKNAQPPVFSPVNNDFAFLTNAKTLTKIAGTGENVTVQTKSPVKQFSFTADGSALAVLTGGMLEFYAADTGELLGSVHTAGIIKAFALPPPPPRQCRTLHFKK